MSSRTTRKPSVAPLGAGATPIEDNRVVLPDSLPGGAGSFFRKALATEALAQNFTWVFKRYEPGADFVGLVDQFLQRYEKQIARLAGEKLDGAARLLRAGVTYRMLDALRPHRMKMAEMAVNPLFVEVFLKKRLLAEIMGITLQDVERRIALNAKRPTEFLDEELRGLLPKTFLRGL